MPSPSRGNNFMLFLMVFGTLTGIVASIGLELVNYMLGWSMSLTSANIFYHLASIFLPCILYFLVVRQPLGETLPFKRLSPLNAALILFMTLCIEPLAMLTGSVTSLFAGNEVSAHIMEMYDQPFALVVLAVCVSPAIFEELALRGIVLGNYSRLGVKKAAFMNGLFFGIMHLQLEQFFYTFLLGAVFVYFVYYTKSIWASVFAHFVFNFTQTAISYTSYHSALEEGMTLEEMLAPTPFSEQLAGIIGLAVISVISTFVFCVLMYAFRQHNMRLHIIEKMEEDEELLWLSHDIAKEPALAPEPNPKERILTWSFWALLVFYAAFVALNYYLLDFIALINSSL